MAASVRCTQTQPAETDDPSSPAEANEGRGTFQSANLLTFAVRPSAQAKPARVSPRFVRMAAVAGLLLFALAFSGARPISEPDEGRYTAVALQMLKSGNWLTPHLHPDVPHFTKPPLTYWAIAASLALFGHNEVAARLPSTLAFVLTVLLVAGIASRLRESRPTFAAVVYATCLLPFAAANIITTDSLLTLWETLAAYGFVSALMSATAAHRSRGLLVMWLGLGLAFMTKGPVGLLPLVAFGAFMAMTEGRAGLRRLASPLSLALFAAVALPWYLVTLATHEGLLSYYLWDETVARASTNTFHRNGEWYGAFRVYGPVLLLGSLPWGLLVLARRPSVKRLFKRETWARWRRQDQPLLLLLLWFLIPLAVFVVVRSRLPLYLVPLFVPLALLMTRALARDGAPTRSKLVVAAVAAALLIAVKAGVAHVPSVRNVRTMAEAIASAVNEPIDEIVLVDTRNGYGLSFYLGANVQHVSLHSLTPDLKRHDRTQTVDQELSVPEPRRLFVVPDRSVSEFENVTAPLGRLLEATGRWQGFAFYWMPADVTVNLPSR